MEVLASRVKKFIEKVNDIIFLKEKTLVVILRDNKIKEDIKKEFKEYPLKFIKQKNILSEKSLLNLIYDGFSFKHNRQLGKNFGIEPLILITYSLKNLDHIKKTLFGYALKGRANEKGLLGEIKGEVIGRNSIKIPYKKLSVIKEFLDYWKIFYKTKKIIEVENE